MASSSAQAGSELKRPTVAPFDFKGTVRKYLPKVSSAELAYASFTLS